MSFIYSYISYLLGWNIEESKENNKPLKHPLITNEQLLKVKLKSSKDDLQVKNEENNTSLIETFELLSSNGNNLASLEEILSVKLKPIPNKNKQTYFPPRNPVIRQMNEKFGINS
jgi:hypothetical protein